MATALTGMMQRVTDLFKGGKDALIRDKLREAWKGMPEYPRSQPKAERVKWLLKRFYYEAQYEKLQLHRKWFRNHLFFGGYHDSVLSDIGFTFDSLGVNSAEYGFASNYYRSYIRYGTAMYVQTAPEFVAQPTSPDPESQGVASAARSALEMIKENIGYDAIRAIEAQNLRLYGNSFRYSYYSVDPRYGFQDAPVYEDVEAIISEGRFYCPQCGMQGQGNMDVCPQCGPDAQMPPFNLPPQMGQVPVLRGRTSYPKGQEMCEVVWPFEGYMRSSCKSLSVAPFFLRVRMADTVALHATFPKADFGANSSPVEGMTASEDIGLIYQQAAADLPNDPTQYPGWYERATGQSKSLLIQGWIRPNQYYFDSELKEEFGDDGLYGAMTDDCLLETRKESIDDHWTHFKHIHVEGRVWGDGDDDLIPIQMQNDECDRMLMRHVDWNTMPVMMGDPQKVDKNNIWNDAGYMVEVKNLGQRNLDQVLKWFPGGQISTDVWAWKNTRLQDMQFHSGVSPAAIGQHEPGVNTFGGQETAVSRSQAMLGPLQLMYKEQNELWAVQMLKICAKNWLDDRVQAAMGVNGQWEFRQLRGELLKMDRVRIVARIIPEDFNKQQSLVQAISAGAFNPQLPPAVRRKVLELYQMPTDLDSYSSDEKVQQKEIDGAKQSGQFPKPAIWQNDDAHMDSLSHWANSDEFDGQPPEVKVATQRHFLDHIQNKATKMAIAGAIQGAHAEAGGQPEQGGEQQNPNDNAQFRQNRAQQGAAAKPNRPQPPGGNQNRTGRRGMSESSQQKRRNGRTR